MKFLVLLFSSAIVFSNTSHAQVLKNILKKDSSLQNKVNGLFSGNSSSLSTTEIANGLKEALNKGVETGTSKLSAVDGFFKDAAIKILLPPEAQKVEKTLRSAGFDKPVDEAILSMNRAAEDAAKSAAPIFLNAIKQMTINDAVGILKGRDSAATTYLRTKSTAALTEAFKPIISTSLEKVDATKYWNTVFTTYNKLPFATSKVNPDLTAYVTDKALAGIFHEIALQEMQIRQNPAARTTDLLKKVFGQ
ncbi:DUF4197 domain-containing protein [Ilyomonas limi]|uniref:DUF4197 domain-containing protein n=1 Tax=Ilyomonas limi TaxID=2575867 RepID=A0A4U3L0G6_9BACT|nr:DUF4197 domain-containing protein [Ilyomonas limi]TKK66927.1 DUF4197 domain-containing protein [Ilyomonas limi]